MLPHWAVPTRGRARLRFRPGRARGHRRTRRARGYGLRNVPVSRGRATEEELHQPRCPTPRPRRYRHRSAQIRPRRRRTPRRRRWSGRRGARAGCAGHAAPRDAAQVCRVGADDGRLQVHPLFVGFVPAGSAGGGGPVFAGWLSGVLGKCVHPGRIGGAFGTVTAGFGSPRKVNGPWRRLGDSTRPGVPRPGGKEDPHAGLPSAGRGGGGRLAPCGADCPSAAARPYPAWP